MSMLSFRMGSVNSLRSTETRMPWNTPGVREILDCCVRRRSLATLSKHHLREYRLEEWCSELLYGSKHLWFRMWSGVWLTQGMLQLWNIKLFTQCNTAPYCLQPAAIAPSGLIPVYAKALSLWANSPEELKCISHTRSFTHKQYYTLDVFERRSSH